MVLKISNELGGVKTWIWVGVVVFLLVGVMYWDWGQHAQVEKFVAEAPDIPGRGLPTGGSPELVEFEKVKSQFTRMKKSDDLRITATWNSPKFFKALSSAEGEHDIKRHEVLYHEYAKRFRVHSDIVFTLVMDSESFDLFEYLVKENAFLRNDKGDEVKPLRWSKIANPSAQHLEGILYFSQIAVAGRHMIGHLPGQHMPGERPPTFIELVIKGLPGNKEEALRWELPRGPEE